MEVAAAERAVAEEKKTVWKAKKTMKQSDRQQLETLHKTLGRHSSNSSSPPPTMNGMHKEDGQKGSDKEQSDTRDSKSPAGSPQGSPRSPPIALSLSLSPSPPRAFGPSLKDKEDSPPASPSSPFHCLNNELKKMEEEGKKARSPSPATEDPTTSSAEAEQEKTDTAAEEEQEKKEETETAETERKETHTPTPDSITDRVNGVVSPPLSPASPVATANSNSEKGPGIEQGGSPTVGKDAERTMEAEAPEASTATEERSGSPKATTDSPPPATSSSSLSPHTDAVADVDMKDEEEVKEEDQPDKEETKEEEEEEEEEKKMDLDVNKDIKVEKKVKVEGVKVEKVEGVKVEGKGSSSSSCSLSNKVVVKEEKRPSSGHKRATSEDGHVERDGKRQKTEGVELEAQLELKITATGSHHKIEKLVQGMLEKHLRGLEMKIFDVGMNKLKSRVDQIDCSSKHQSVLNAIQAKVGRLVKRVGEANQSAENKKQEALTAPKTVATVNTANTSPSQRPPVRTSMEVKQMPTTVSTNISASSQALAKPPSAASTPTNTTSQPIYQLISTTNAVTSTLGTGTMQSQPTGTLLLKTGARGNMVSQGQPLLIQLSNGQTGALVNIPVSSFASVNPLNKGKTTQPTTTFILKTPTTTTAAASAAVVPAGALQAATGQISPAQISLARAVYQGGAGNINTPHAGVSVTTARAPAQSISVAGAVSAASNLASGPAATGSTAPGPPSGTTMTSKTDNPTGAKKGSFIDLTEDDDDVMVTGVKKPTVTGTSSLANQRPGTGPPPLISTPTGSNARSSPQQSISNLHTVHHRSPLDSPVKGRAGNAGTPNRSTLPTTLPALPMAPQPPRLPQEANSTSPPQQPTLKLARVQSQNGIVLSWCVTETDRSCAQVESYHLYAYHMDNSAANGSGQQHWKKIGEVKALPLPMACTLTQFVSGSTYYFAVRARDIYGRFGSFCEPQCTDVISSS